MICVGRARKAPEAALFDRYAARLPWPLTLREVDERRPLKGEVLKRREAELLLAQVPQGARVVALDERGRDLSSPEIAAIVGRWRDDGCRDIAFIVGGADGLDRSVLERADLVLALGRATWPHMLVRAMLAEQIYRIYAILSGHPYHRA